MWQQNPISILLCYNVLFNQPVTQIKSSWHRSQYRQLTDRRSCIGVCFVDACFWKFGFISPRLFGRIGCVDIGADCGDSIRYFDRKCLISVFATDPMAC
jgi:hypothetical protein